MVPLSQSLSMSLSSSPPDQQRGATSTTTPTTITNEHSDPVIVVVDVVVAVGSAQKSDIDNDIDNDCERAPALSSVRVPRPLPLASPHSIAFVPPESYHCRHQLEEPLSPFPKRRKRGRFLRHGHSWSDFPRCRLPYP